MRSRVCACACVRVSRARGARRGVRVHTPAQSTAPLQCSVGLRTVFTRAVLRIYITRAALTATLTKSFWCIIIFNFFLNVLKNILIVRLHRITVRCVQRLLRGVPDCFVD